MSIKQKKEIKIYTEMKVIKKIQILVLALAAVGFASVQGQESVGAPNFNFEYGGNGYNVSYPPGYSWTLPDGTVVTPGVTPGVSTNYSKNAGWQLWHARHDGSSNSSNPTQLWQTWSQTINWDTAESGQKFCELYSSGTADQTNGLLPRLPSAIDTSIHYAAKIGTSIGGYDATMLTYNFNVTANNYLLTFYYAVVIENPSGHGPYEQPLFQIDVVSGAANAQAYNLVNNCAFFERNILSVLAANDPHWHPVNGSTSSTSWWYCDWQRISLNLAEKIGQNVVIRMRICDCTQSGHGGMAYFVGKASEPTIEINGCSQGDTVAYAAAPAGFAGYQWYVNTTGCVPGTVGCGEPIPASLGGTNDTLFILQSNRDSIMDQNGNATQLFCEMTSSSTTGIACKGYLSASLTDTKPSPGFIARNTSTYSHPLPKEGTLDFWFQNTTFENRNNTKPHYYCWIVDGTDTVAEWTSTSAPGGTNTDLDTNLKSPSYTFTTCGAHTVKLIASHYDPVQGWCESSVTKDIFIPCINMMQDTLICVNSEYTSYVEISNSTDLTNPNLFWFHTKDTDTLSTSTSYTHTYDEGDTLIVKVTTGFGSNPEIIMYDTLVVDVQAFPEIQLTGDTILCMGQSTNITVQDLSGTVVGFKWMYYPPTAEGYPGVDVGTNLNPILPSFQPYQDTTIYILVQTSQGCRVYDSVTIHVTDPVIHSDTTKVCPGGEVRLWGTNAAYYSWTASPNDPMCPTDTATTFSTTPNQTTTYTMSGYGSNGCHSERTLTIEVIPFPVATIEYTPAYVDISTPTVSFVDVSNDGATSVWNFSDGGNATWRSGNYSFRDVSGDSVWIKLTSRNSLGCGDDTLIWLPVRINTVWVPSAFTPDGDALNDYLFFSTLNTLYDLSFEIFNRWGTVVYSFYSKQFDAQSAGANAASSLGWDGKINGKPAPQGTYVYRLQYRMSGAQKVYDQTGTINLVK